MPTGQEYVCNDCGADALITVKDFMLGPFPEKWTRGPPKDATPEERAERKRQIQEWEARCSQYFTCDSCDLKLFLPKEIERAEWVRWKREDARSRNPYTYPFLVSLAARIDKELNSSTRCTMDFGALCCPYCSRPLVSKGDISPKCRHCGSSNTKLFGVGIVSGRFPDPWPPVI